AGNEAAFHFTLTVTAGDTKMVIEPIDVMVFDSEGKIRSMKAYWSPESVTQLEQAVKRPEGEARNPIESENREPDRDVVADRGDRGAGVEELVIAERGRPRVGPVQRIHDSADAVQQTSDGQQH